MNPRASQGGDGERAGRAEVGRGAATAATVREILDEGGLPLLRVVAIQALRGEIRFRPMSPRNLRHFKHGMLRWAVSDDAASRRDWAALQDDHRAESVLRDRDRYVEELWRGIESSPEQADVHGFLEEHLGALETYRRYLFDWFLRRFHIDPALRIYRSRARGLTLCLAFLAVAVAAAALPILLPASTRLNIFAGLAGLVALSWLARALTGLGWNQAMQLLFPRLAAGVAIGYLFLTSAPELVRVAAGESLVSSLALVVVLGVLTYLYSAFHVSGRVHPRVHGRRLWGSSGLLFALGVVYALLGLPLFTPLFSLAEFQGTQAPIPLGPHQLLLLAAVALALGMVLELAWEEKPMTEPL